MAERKKEKEKVGKDQDWIEAGQHLELPDDVRREFCAVQEQDAAFLMSYGVMDYSLLVGIHNMEDAQQAGPPGWRENGGGLWAVGGKILYFAGMIDFLIAYDMKKEGEHMIRVIQNHAKDASCVDPASYARRNVLFIREHVVVPPSKASVDGKILMDSRGTLGSLKITIVSAKDLINMDGILSRSDPYVAVDLGLIRVTTPVIMNDLNPVWNHTVTMPVDDAHKEMDIIFSLWDEDQNKRFQGEDDSLGRTQVSVKEVMQTGTYNLQKALERVKKGELTATLEWIPASQEAV